MRLNHPRLDKKAQIGIVIHIYEKHAVGSLQEKIIVEFLQL